MNIHLENIKKLLQDTTLPEEQRQLLFKSIVDADKAFEIASFKLDRTEKVKRTTAILLEETIEELEHKRKAAEAQNRELEIESSLERVRTVAMSMNKPDDMLEVCKTIALQLQSLGVKEIRNVQTAIFYPDRGTYMNYEFYARHDKTFITETVYTNHEVANAFAGQMFKGKGEVYTTHIKGDEVKDWLAYQKSTNVFIDTYLENATSLSYYWHSLGPVALGISTYIPLGEEDLQLFQRFLKVFDLSYRRYLDIEKAIAQTREAQIQLALERVRARTMAMQLSDELPDAANILFQQMQTLGMPAWSAGYCIWDDDHQAITLWMSSAGIIQQPFRAPVTEDPSFIHFYDSWKRGETFYTEEIGGEAIVSHYKYMCRLPVVGDMLNKFIADGGSLPAFQIFHLAFFSQGFLLFITYEPVPESHDIFKRFGNVFDQTYTRFLDLQKAEAQAKESKIQLALERVRARTMAMQKSDELSETAFLLFQQFKQLGKFPDQITIGIINEPEQVIEFWLTIQGHQMNRNVKASIHEPTVMHKMYTGWATQKKSIVIDLTGKELADYIIYRNTLSKKIDAPESNDHHEGRRVINVAFFSKGFLTFSSPQPCEEESIGLLERFAGVFDQTYTRFLDLQKAEAQAKEAQIETALERVRSRSMAMQKSEELKEVIQVVYDQFVYLNINTEHTGFVIDYKATDDHNIWVADKHGINSQVSIPYFDAIYYNQFNDAKQKGLDFFATNLSFEEKNDFYQKLFTYIPALSEKAKEFYFSCPGLVISTVLLENVGLYIENFSGIPYSEEDNKTLMRFGKVFQQTYTRFIDLQKAEAQSREAQIQLALERGRTQSMIMQHSKELDDTLRVFHEQVLLLGINSAFSFLWLPDEEKSNHIFWAAWAEENNNTTVFKSKAITYPLDRNEPATAQCLVDWKSGGPVVSYAVPPEGVKNYFAAWQELIDGVEKLTPAHFTNGLYYVEAFMKYGCFGVILENDLNDNEKKILNRFAVEFERAYTRFLDLQKAEAQAREAQIETALEKVRSRSLAMHKSDELQEVVNTVFEQLNSLHVEMNVASIFIFKENSKDWEQWVASADTNYSTHFHLSYTDNIIFRDLDTARQNGKDFYTARYSFEEKNNWFTYAFANTEYSRIPEQRKIFLLESEFYLFSFALSKNVGLQLARYSGDNFSEIDNEILRRFCRVFEQAYIRFLDLQKAEAQAKEAQIEAALEKVRSRTMAMQNSNELQETAVVLFNEFKKLGTDNVYQVTIGIYNEAEGLVDFRVTNWAGSGEQENRSFLLDMAEPTVVQPSVAAWKAGKKSLVVDLTGEALEGWINYRNKMSGVTISSKDTEGRRVISIAYFSKGHISISSPMPVPQETIKTLERFAVVFDGTYTRFLDLEKAEAQAREAQIETALEKVRSRTLAMQKSDELAETAAEVFRQLISLGIEPNRLYIGIVKEETSDMEMWATDEDGTHVGRKFMFNKNENISVKKLFDGWKAKEKSVIVDMEGKELEDYFHYLNNVMHIPFKGGLTQKRRVQSVAYFSKGFIGMASPDGQGDVTIQLLERFAAVFNLTFTRFNDLKIAEAHALQAEEDLIKLQTEKKRAEDALTELRATQTQLIQSEKMASLGELTAGIAHEIQNPLNFVNNFSEVSNELMDEMNAEIEKGDLEEAKLIANDIKQNLEKINHHGKRADAIVKGMLQHSRATSATKELTDINKLADEYLRLAYHGLRAKDKSFNATLKTEYDETLEKINIIPQDMGRVILNLITNAFYVVDEKKKQLAQGMPTFERLASLYEPTVSVSTKKLGDKVEIKVTDNGNGIPKNILDKIFQPFFTTKPTGQGTGLGLSLAYDIVKAHGGELKVETKEREGTIFTIQLPANA